MGAPIAAAVFAEVFVYAQQGGDPASWPTELLGLGIAGLLALYLYLDNARLRKDLATERANTAMAETAMIAHVEQSGREPDRLRIYMLTRYETLVPLEKEGQ